VFAVDEDAKQFLLVVGAKEFPLSLDNGHLLLVQGIYKGRVHITDHFKKQSKERRFTTIEMERAIKGGRIIAPPEYCEEFKNWVFRVEGLCDTRQFEARVALDWSEDLDDPLVVYITGIYKGDTRWQGKSKKK